MSAETKTLRLFFALWPDDAARASLAGTVEALKRATTAKWVKPENLHITLAFLGEVDEDRLPLVNRAADSIIGRSFKLELDRIEFWPRSGIVCLSPASTPEDLKKLVSGLTAELGGVGFVMESRPYRAHLTVARKARPGVVSQALADPIDWNVRSFDLVESRISRAGSLYLVRESWSLQSL